MIPRRRRSEGAPRSFRPQDSGTGRRPLRRGDRPTEKEAGRDRALLRGPAHPDGRRTRPLGGIGGDRPGAVPRRAAASAFSAEVGVAGTWQPRQSQPRDPAHLRSISLCLRQCCERSRSHGAVRNLRGAGVRQAPLSSGNRQPQLRTEVKVDTKNPDRGPLLIISGEKDNTVPWAIATASYKQQKRSQNVTEIIEMPNRGHALVIDSGWREVADKALAFVRRFV